MRSRPSSGRCEAELPRPVWFRSGRCSARRRQVHRAPERQSIARHPDNPEQRDRSERQCMQHQRRTDRRINRGAVRAGRTDMEVSTCRSVCGKLPLKPGRRQSRSTTVITSSRRSTIVASTALALNRSRRASRYGRRTSPNRAGSTALVAESDHRRSRRRCDADFCQGP